MLNTEYLVNEFRGFVEIVGDVIGSEKELEKYVLYENDEKYVVDDEIIFYFYNYFSNVDTDDLYFNDKYIAKLFYIDIYDIIEFENYLEEVREYTDLLDKRLDDDDL